MTIGNIVTAQKAEQKARLPAGEIVKGQKKHSVAGLATCSSQKPKFYPNGFRNLFYGYICLCRFHMPAVDVTKCIQVFHYLAGGGPKVILCRKEPEMMLRLFSNLVQHLADPEK